MQLGLSRLQKIVAALAGCIFIATLFLISQDDFIIKFLHRKSMNDKIGTVSAAKDDARRRLANSLVWLNLSENEEIYDGDSIFSGPKSLSIVRSDQSGEISIKEN